MSESEASARTSLAGPQAGVHYPKSFAQFTTWFQSEAECSEFLARVRWADGFVCPRCGGAGEPWSTSRGLYMCRQCGRQVSPKSGTIFHRSKYPLQVWFTAMWFVCAQKTGMSALNLYQQFGFGSYETAWTWMQKLRRAMVVPGRELLGGPNEAVEVDQTFVGGRMQIGRGGRYDNKIEVAVAVERRQPVGYGRIRLAQIETSDRANELFTFIQNNIADGTELVTDGDRIYATIANRLQLRHYPINVSKSENPAHVDLPAVHQVASLLKRWIAGTLHYGESSDYIGFYLDEFTFRFNRRRSRSRGMLWFRLVQQAAHTPPHSLKTIRSNRN